VVTSAGHFRSGRPSAELPGVDLDVGVAGQPGRPSGQSEVQQFMRVAARPVNQRSAADQAGGRMPQEDRRASAYKTVASARARARGCPG
jgi:hypothetical protein